MRFYFILTLLVNVILISPCLRAQDRVDYPELSVTPRASERLKIESELEVRRPWLFQWTITVSGLTTLVAGAMQDEDKSKDAEGRSGTVGMIVGGGWLALNAFMAYGARGYKSSYDKIANMSVKTPREQLIRERLAEEEINRLGRLAKTLKWLSFATNSLASVHMMGKVKKNTNSQVMDAVALGGAFLPLLFTSQWEDVAQEQQQYKKKIFGPISSTPFVPVLRHEQTVFIPGILLSTTF